MGYGCAVDHCSINQLRSKWSLLRALPGLGGQPSKTFKRVVLYSHVQYSPWSMFAFAVPMFMLFFTGRNV